MELEFDFSENTTLWQAAVIVVMVLVLVGLGAIGSRVTPLTADGAPKIMSWSDWRLLQAEKAYYAEVEVLQADANQLALMLESRPSPVAAQMLAERITRHTRDGDPSLAPAREALLTAALNVRDWAAGILDRDTAMRSLETAFELLNP
ncbi:MAG: hypothetical protein ACOYYI_09565 [Chloroflexota bacterium]|jgi:hypothetical protein